MCFERVMQEPMIEARGLTKTYKLYDRPEDRVKEAFHPLRKQFHRPFHALNDVSFSVSKGETFGLVGRNGSGKSTLMQLLAGVLQPTSGTVAVKGKVAALLELGAGFNPWFTGRENIYLNGQIQGFTREEIDARLDDILSFADIGDFVDQPVRTYSSGMYVRLAFSVSINVAPDVLLVDEALAVGDIYFQHKCMLRMRQMMDNGVTIVFVSHDMGAVKTLCSRGLLLESGNLRHLGAARDVVDAYYRERVADETGESMAALSSAADRAAAHIADGTVAFKHCDDFSDRIKDTRTGSGGARITCAELLDTKGHPIQRAEWGDILCMRVHIAFYADCNSPNIGFLVRDKNGVEIIGTNCRVEDVQTGDWNAGSRMVIDFQFENILRHGSYSIALAIGISDLKGTVNFTTLDWVDNAVVFEVLPRGDRALHALVGIPVSIRLSSGGNTP
ncbi:MAG: ABC transporter ATP-binding protein [Deltaproteobacteria bacterium]|nr:MAG: ABC transporter ATP-binding protein [Deltaproteobacteria bacterium]